MKFQFVFLLPILLLSCQSAPEIAQAKAKEVITQDAISIPVYDFDGLAPLLAQENDTTYVINFWATWCVPCVAELPYFEQLLEKYKNDKVKLILVSLDFRNKVDQSLIPFLKKNPLKGQVVLLDDNDSNTWISKIDPSWTGALPATIIYRNKQGAFFEKSFTFTELETELLNIKNN